MSKRNKSFSSKQNTEKLLISAMLLVIVVAGVKFLPAVAGSKVLGASTLIAKGGSNESGEDSGSNGSSSPSHEVEPIEVKPPQETEVHTESPKPVEIQQIEPSKESVQTSLKHENSVGDSPRGNEKSGSGGTQKPSTILFKKPVVSPTPKVQAVHFEIKNEPTETEKSDSPDSKNADAQSETEVKKNQEQTDLVRQKVESHLAEDNIKIATTGAERFLLQKGNSAAVTSFPVTVDAVTNQISVTTSAGQRNVTVLPEQAIQNLINAKLVSRVGESASVSQLESTSLNSVSDLISLNEKDGIPVYEVKGVSDQKFLGFIPVQVKKDVTVSAETGDVLSVNTTLGTKILDILSF